MLAFSDIDGDTDHARDGAAVVSQRSYLCLELGAAAYDRRALLAREGRPDSFMNALLAFEHLERRAADERLRLDAEVVERFAFGDGERAFLIQREEDDGCVANHRSEAPLAFMERGVR